MTKKDLNDEFDEFCNQYFVCASKEFEHRCRGSSKYTINAWHEKGELLIANFHDKLYEK